MNSVLPDESSESVRGSVFCPSAPTIIRFGFYRLDPLNFLFTRWHARALLPASLAAVFSRLRAGCWTQITRVLILFLESEQKKLKIDFEVIAFYTCIQRQKRTSTISKSILHTRPPFFFPPLSFQLLSPELDSVVPQSDNYLNLLVRSSRQDRFLLRRFSFTFYSPFSLLKFMNCEHFFTCARVFDFSIFSVAMRRAVPYF